MKYCERLVISHLWNEVIRCYVHNIPFENWWGGQHIRHTIIGLINRKINRVQHWIMEKYESFLLFSHAFTARQARPYKHDDKKLLSLLRRGGRERTTSAIFHSNSFPWHFSLFLKFIFLSFSPRKHILPNICYITLPFHPPYN